MQEATCSHAEAMWIKRRFYISSLTLLFWLIVIVQLDFSTLFAWFVQERSAENLLWDLFIDNFNFSVIIASICGLLCKCVTNKLDRKFKGSLDGTAYIKTIKNEEFEYLTFLTTYIIPLACLNFSDFRYWVVLALLLTIIGNILVRTEKYYANPTLAVRGYRLYRAKVVNSDGDVLDSDGNIYEPGTEDEIVLITKTKLKLGTKINWIKIDENIWYAKEKEE